MFLPLVTNSRSPTTLAPVVIPTSCLIEPRYSTLSDDTQSGPDLLAAAFGATARVAVTASATQRRTYPTAPGTVAMRRSRGAGRRSGATSQWTVGSDRHEGVPGRGLRGSAADGAVGRAGGSRAGRRSAGDVRGEPGRGQPRARDARGAQQASHHRQRRDAPGRSGLHAG